MVRRDPHPPERLAGGRPAAGSTATYALLNLQERGTLFVGPGAEVYEGMIVGENARREDMDVNPTKERKLTNMRSSTAEELVRLSPPTAVARAGSRVPARGRVRGSDARLRAAPQGRPAPRRPRQTPSKGT